MTIKEGGGERKDVSIENVISLYIQTKLNGKDGDENDLREIVEYLKALEKTDSEDAILDISFDINTNLSSKERKEGKKGEITFRVIVEGGKYSLLPANSTEHGFRLLDQINKKK